MSTVYGPVELVAIRLADGTVPPEAQAALARVVDAGVLTLLDLALVSRPDEDTVEVLEADDLDESAGVSPFVLAAAGLAAEEDVVALAEGLEVGETALVVAFEHTWTREIVAALGASGAEMIAVERIPAEAVNEVAALGDALAAAED